MYKKYYIKKPKVLKYLDQKQIGSLPRIFICSLLVIFFFYSTPLILDFTNNKKNAFDLFLFVALLLILLYFLIGVLKLVHKSSKS